MDSYKPVTESILEIQRRILVFGNSAMLGELAATLRLSPLLKVVERKTSRAVKNLRPDVVLVDGLHITPEQFSELIIICPTILSFDPDTHQLTVLTSPSQSGLAETARLIGIMSLALQPA